MRRPSFLPPGAVIAGAVMLMRPSVAASGPPAFEAVELSSDNGTAQLIWADQGSHYEVQLQAPGTPPRTVYTGWLPSAHVSGLTDGDYEARVRAAGPSGRWSAWSEPARVSVAHHHMGSVWALLGTGAVTFLGTAGFLLVMSRRGVA